MNKFSKLFCIVILTMLPFLSLYSQPSTIVDEIVAVVGDQIVLKTDIEKQLSELSFTDSTARSGGRCEILRSVIYQKLLLNQAYLDSIVVSEEQITGELDRRLNVFISQIGSKEKLEEYYGKTLSEIKNEMHDPIKEMLLTQEMRDKIIGKYKISPSEVISFFKTVPADSLPYYNAEVEIAQVLIYLKPTKDEDQKALDKITNLKKRIQNGEQFEKLAILYTDDNNTAAKGGDLGFRNKAEFVPEFSAIAFRLKKDSVSEVVKTKFGYHLIKQIDRKGDKIQVKHILIKPKLTNESKTKTLDLLNDLLYKIKTDTLSFDAAAMKYSEDDITKNNGGLLLDNTDGSSKIPTNKLDPSIFFTIDTMKVGHISPPVKYTGDDGRIGFRIIYLKSRTAPHKANLKDDFAKIKDWAENSKKSEVLQKWVDKAIKRTYITINPPYNTNCANLKDLTKPIK